MSPKRIFLILAGVLAFSHGAAAEQTDAPEASKTEIAGEVIAQGLVRPWGLQFLPDGRFLVTELPARMRVIAKDGTLSKPILGLPDIVTSGRQAGLLDVLLARDFSGKSGIVYFSYAEPRGFFRNGTAVMRAILTLTDDGGELSDGLVIFRQEPAIASLYHFGSRLIWANDGTLFITTGERASQPDSAQDLTTDLGKVIRINPDGTVPDDNPFVGAKDVRPEIWSYGHRNMQGAVLHPVTGELWETEHGARGGDELNIVRPGKNYGWPVITWGIDYDGSKIGEGTTKEGMEQPAYYWTPSIAVSGLAFYTGDLFKAWKGNVLAGGLASRSLERLVLDGETVTGVETLLADRRERIRDVRQGPDGAVYVLTDEMNGKLLRLSPKS